MNPQQRTLPEPPIQERKIKDTVDKLGNPIELHWSLTLGGNECFTMVLDVYSELLKKGWANSDVVFDNKNRIIYAKYPDGTIGGGIVFKYFEDLRTGWILLSFTAPDHRGKGINGLCHEFVENECKRLGAKSISSFVHIDNAPRLAAAKKVGLEPQYYRTYKKL
jgi:GNAT superfamily N-acetyltransferase